MAENQHRNLAYNISMILKEENLAESEISGAIYSLTFVGLKILQIEIISANLKSTIAGTGLTSRL